MHRGNETPYQPRLIAWELTRSCNLRCQHCRAAAQAGPYEDELTTQEVFRVLESIAAHYKPIMILTGGEPLMRPDLEQIVRRTKELDLRPVLATCGSLLSPGMARHLKAWGIERLSFSIDGPDAPSHDDFRGVPGAFDQCMDGVAAARNAGLPFQVNTTVTRRNVDDIECILELAVEIGAVAFHPFLLVPTGRGAQLKQEALNAAEYEQALNRIYELQRGSPIPFKPTCAPHYYRVLRQREAEAGRHVTPATHGLDAMSKGCMGGTGFAFISHRGDVQICGFLEECAGNLRETDYDFDAIWQNSPLFEAMRDPERLDGKCRICEYQEWCGGCRARAYAMTENYLASEPFCAYVPTRGGHNR